MPELTKDEGEVGKRVAMLEFPEEIVLEILLRLPVKSLSKFKTVSKSWGSILRSKQFAKKHLNHAHATQCNHHKSFLAVHVPFAEASAGCFLLKDVSDGIILAKYFDFPFKLLPEQIPLEVYNYCDGLICINLFHYGMLLWNPSLPAEYKMISPSKLVAGFGALGYDPITDDYKLVRAPYRSTDGSCPGSEYFFVEVFSLKNNSWRKKIISKKVLAYEYLQPNAIYTRNRLHWIATASVNQENEMNLVIYFDIAEESFNYVNLPKITYNDSNWTASICKDSFGIMGASSPGQEELWVLQDYCGMKSIWNKIFKIESLGNMTVYYHSCFTNNGELFIHAGELGLRIYDTKDGNFKNAVIHGHNNITGLAESVDTFHVSPYVESLVSIRWFQ